MIMNWFRKELPIAICAILALYLLGYFTLIVRDCPAVSNGQVRFRSCSRFAPDADLPGSPITITVGEVTALNYLYYPMDLIYYFSRDLKKKWTIRSRVER